MSESTLLTNKNNDNLKSSKLLTSYLYHESLLHASKTRTKVVYYLILANIQGKDELH